MGDNLINPGRALNDLNWKQEQEAVLALDKLQQGNARKLAALRMALLKDLQEEAIKSGEKIEDYLAEYRLDQRLKALSAELQAIQQAEEGQLAAISELRQKAEERIAQAHAKLYSQLIGQISKNLDNVVKTSSGALGLAFDDASAVIAQNLKDLTASIQIQLPAEAEQSSKPSNAQSVDVAVRGSSAATSPIAPVEPINQDLYALIQPEAFDGLYDVVVKAIADASAKIVQRLQDLNLRATVVDTPEQAAVDSQVTSSAAPQQSSAIVQEQTLTPSVTLSATVEPLEPIEATVDPIEATVKPLEATVEPLAPLEATVEPIEPLETTVSVNADASGLVSQMAAAEAEMDRIIDGLVQNGLATAMSGVKDLQRAAEESARAAAEADRTIALKTLQDKLDARVQDGNRELQDQLKLAAKAGEAWYKAKSQAIEDANKAQVEQATKTITYEMNLLGGLRDKYGKPLFTADQILNPADEAQRLAAVHNEYAAKQSATIAALNEEQQKALEAAKAEAQRLQIETGVEVDEAAIAEQVGIEYGFRKTEALALLQEEEASRIVSEKRLTVEREKANKKAETLSKKEQEKQLKEKQKKNTAMAKELMNATDFSERFGKLGSIMNDFKAAFGDGTAAIDELVASGEMSREEAEKAVAEAKQEAKKEMAEKATAAVNDWATELNTKGKEIAKKQTGIDTRLQGLSSDVIKKKGGSYYRSLEKTVGSGVGISPFLKQEDVVASIEKLTQKGIAYNLQERAFLDTVSEKIANTFNATDSALLKLVRIQQADTTAARLGMESALTAFLNNMYATSEYMTDAAESVRQSLVAATSLMEAEESTEFEYQVQKWMGSLYSVGFTQSESLAAAIGKLASGDIEAITGGGMGNLLVMAVNEAGMSVSKILEEGLDDEDTNKLFNSMVIYLAKIYGETKDSRVLSQQFADVYGLTAADLKAAANLSRSVEAVAKNSLSYDGMLERLDTMANTMHERTSAGEMFQNALENFSYNMASTMGSNPVLSSLNTVANMLNDLVGGIEIPFVNVYGFGFDLNATVADLMNVAALSGSVLGGMGKLISSLGSGGGFSGSGMLKAFGVEKGQLDTVHRGSGGVALTEASGTQVSESGFVGNESSDDVKNKTISDASAGPEQQIAEAKEEQEDKENARTNLVVSKIVSIYDLLTDITNGSKKLYVQLATSGAWGGNSVQNNWSI